MKRVNDLFPNWFTSGGTTSDDFTGFISNLIYPYLPSQDRPSFQVPYSTSVFPSYTYGTKATWLSSLDVLFSSRFGNRKLMPFIENLDLHNKASETITADQIKNTNTIAQMINIRFGDKWNHIAEALAIEYNPLENYNRIEDSSFENNSDADNYDSTTLGKKLSGSGESISESTDARKDTKTIEGGWDDGDNTTVTTSGDYKKKTKTSESIDGFNGTATFGSAGSPTGYTEVEEEYDYNSPGSSGAYKETHGGKLSHDYHGKDLSSKYTEENSREGSEYTKHHIDGTDSGWNYSEISGNIGVTTSQQMLESELEVRKNLLYDIILGDIADFLCVSIY